MTCVMAAPERKPIFCTSGGHCGRPTPQDPAPCCARGTCGKTRASRVCVCTRVRVCARVRVSVRARACVCVCAVSPRSLKSEDLRPPLAVVGLWGPLATFAFRKFRGYRSAVPGRLRLRRCSSEVVLMMLQHLDHNIFCTYLKMTMRIELVINQRQFK